MLFRSDLKELKAEIDDADTRRQRRAASPTRAGRAAGRVDVHGAAPSAHQVKEGDVHGTGDGGHPGVVAGQCDRLALVAQVFAGRQL